MSVLDTAAEVVGGDHVRPGTPADAVDGVPVAAVAAPADTGQVAGLLKRASADGRVVVARGSGTALDWGAPPAAPVDLLLDLSRLDATVDHAAGDLVVRVSAGVRLDTLADRLAEARQRFALDPSERAATVGGVIAASPSGPLRHRYGTVRDLLLGVTVVLADGTVATSGGTVVKNVAGYDLGRLYCGSLGTLGVVVEAVLRLHPLPAARRVVTMPAPDAETVAGLAARFGETRLVPSAVEYDSAAGQVTALFEGPEQAVDAQAAAVAEAGAVAGADPPDWWSRPPWAADAGEVGLKITYAPGRLTALLAALPTGVRLRGRVVAGVLEAALPLPIGADPGQVAAELGDVLASLRAVVRPGGGSVVVLAAPPELKRRLDVWGDPGDAVGLMRRVKAQFDPAGVLAPGRFVGGI